MTLTSQVTNTTKERLYLRPTNISNQNIDMEPDIDIEPITQQSQPPNEDITDMDLEAEP